MVYAEKIIVFDIALPTGMYQLWGNKSATVENIW